MEQKNVVIVWDRNFFDGEKRLLPDSTKLYTQLLNTPDEGDNWSLVFEFKETPRDQGYKSKAKVSFLVSHAPHEILKSGFQFDFLDGPRKIGVCKVSESETTDFMSEIRLRIELIEEEKRDFQNFVNSLLKNDFESDENSFKDIFKYINDYPYLFKLALNQDENLAKEYLQKYFFKSPVDNNVVYRSNLSFFLFQLNSSLGEKKYSDLIKKLPIEVKDSIFIKRALDELD